MALLDGLLADRDLPELLAALRRYGLVRSSDSHLRLHRLVQDITRWPLNAEAEASLVGSWAAHLEALAPDPEDHRSVVWFGEVAPHVLVLMGHAQAQRISPPALGRLGNQLGISLIVGASFRSATTILQGALGIKEAAYGPDHPQVGSTLTNLGVVRRELGDHAGAVEAYERALGIFEAAYGSDHPQVATTLGNLGVVRQELGDHAGAV